MRYPVLLLTHNTLELTKRCIASIEEQDVLTSIFVIDNDSSDGTEEWLSSDEFNGVWQRFSPQLGVSEGWNVGLKKLFYEPSWKSEFVLCPNSDTVLPPWFLSSLLSYDAPFVTGISVNTIETIAAPEPRKELAPGPDFSAFLIRRDAFETIGEFDSAMKLYASDLDYHIRAHRAGVRLMNAGVPFYHERSSTLKNASPRDRREIEIQADADRITLQEKWGCRAWDASYAAMFDEKFFGVDAK
jgi:GT2 family glycosyltransferase